jgi:putative acetyltransferase
MITLSILKDKTMQLTIRNEQPEEYQAIEELTREAFWNVYVPGCDEHFLLHTMRNHPDFIPELDLVAEIDGLLVGNIVYTRCSIVDTAGKAHDIIMFGPISVLPAYQKQGIGGALIRHSFEKARTIGFTAVMIYGDPRYYHRFGFHCAEKWDITTSEGKFAVALMGAELLPGALNGISGRVIESDVYIVDQDAFKKYEATFAPKETFETESQLEYRLMLSLVY